MSWLPLFSMWVMLWSVAKAWRGQLASLHAVEAELAKLEALGRGGVVPQVAQYLQKARQDGGRHGELFPLARVLAQVDRCRRLGLPWHRSLAKMRTVVRRALRHEERARMHWRSFATRASTILTAASLVRWWLVGESADIGSAWLAAMMATTTAWALRSSMPKVLGPSLDTQEKLPTWFSCHLDGVVRRGVPEEAKLREMSRRESCFGLSLLREKRRLLENWARSDQLHRQAALRRWIDLLPLAELVGIGGPLALLLIEPVLSWAP